MGEKRPAEAATVAPAKVVVRPAAPEAGLPAGSWEATVDGCEISAYGVSPFDAALELTNAVRYGIEALSVVVPDHRPNQTTIDVALGYFGVRAVDAAHVAETKVRRDLGKKPA